MKRIFKTMALSAIVIGMLASCQKNKQPVQDTLEVTPTELTFAGSDNEDAVIEVKTGAPEWNFSADGWISATKDGSRLIVNVSDNPEYSVRTGKILFTAGSAKSVRVDVRQDARVKSSLELSTETIEAGSDGGRYEVTVTSAEKWTVSGSCAWCTLTPTEGKSGDRITFNVQPNTTGETLEQEYKVISGTASKVITVISYAVPYMELQSPASGTESFDYNGGDFDVILRTNLDPSQIEYSIAGNDGGWVSVRNVSEATYSVHVSANNTYAARQATVTFSASDDVEPVSVTVSQAKRPYLKVTDPAGLSYDLGLEATQISVTISTNLAVSVSFPSWITQDGQPQVVNEYNGLTSYMYQFNVSATSGSRSGKIEFTYEQSAAAVTVRQVSSDLTYATIPDPVFREYLLDNGYIMENSGETVALTAEGVSATSFDFSWGYTRIASLEGIEAFANLTSINVSECQSLTRVDISGLSKVSSLSLGTAGYIADVVLGDNPITELYYGWETTVYANPVTISGTEIAALVVSATGWGAMADDWHELDVTGCPNLSQIDSQRKNAFTIYVTAEQKDRINNNGNGVLTVR